MNTPKSLLHALLFSLLFLGISAHLTAQFGCTDPLACNFDPTAIIDDGSCIYEACNQDIDGDGIPDEIDNCPFAFNPFQEDFNLDGIGDACSDLDQDGLSDAMEMQFQSDPFSPDTDGDFWSDLQEVQQGTDPTLFDSEIPCFDSYIPGMTAIPGPYPQIPVDLNEMHLQGIPSGYNIFVIPPQPVVADPCELYTLIQPGPSSDPNSYFGIEFYEDGPYLVVAEPTIDTFEVLHFLFIVETNASGTCSLVGIATAFPCPPADVTIVSNELDTLHNWGADGIVVSSAAEAAQKICDAYAANGDQPVSVVVDAHGNSGLIQIGGTTITLANLTDFTDLVQGKISSLTLLSCCTASGQEGKELLCSLEILLGCNVTSYTGAVWANQSTDNPKWWAEGDLYSWDQNEDLDGDGISDWLELTETNTNPFSADSDNDGVDDDVEIANGTDPNNADSDGDGLTDGEEDALGYNPHEADSDGDGCPDILEALGLCDLLADPCPGDLNNDCAIDTADLLIFLTHFGTMCEDWQ